MTKRAVGQPSTSTFDVIKTLYWFSYIEKKVTEDLVNKYEHEISMLNAQLGGANKSRKSMLRTLKNKLARINGKGDFKKKGIHFSEISSYLASKEPEIFGEEAYSIDGVAKLSGKVWGRYASGLYTPSRILDDLNLVYPESKRAYTEGPNNLFKILESNTLNEALELTKVTLIQILKNKSEILSTLQGDNSIERLQLLDYISEIENVFIQNYEFKTSYELLYKLYEVFEKSTEIAEDYSPEGDRSISIASAKYLSVGEAACLYLSFAYMEYKFLGDTISLPVIIGKLMVLDIIEENYGITAGNWFLQNPKNLSNVLAILIDAQETVHYKALSFY